MSYYLIVIDANDKIVERIPADHKTDQELLAKTQKKYLNQNCQFKFGNTVTESQYQEVKALLKDIQQKYPDLIEEVTDKDRPEFQHLGYKLSDNSQYQKKKPKC